MNSTEQQNILLIEDNPGDVRLIQEMLNEITSFHYTLISAGNLKEGCNLILRNKFILILLDLNLPDSFGKGTFDIVNQFSDYTPVVLVSGIQDAEMSLSLIKEGAQDYILKNELSATYLSRTIRFAIERRKLLIQLKEKTIELEHLNSFFINRELRMVELKHEINQLLEMYGEEKRYSTM